ncbi:hypothetical protein [Actinomadura sp. DC4]|uniref:hypothetical protein n=1 Tax=Actinomadura sp. DC4 TaxID=3055069 RepID=UPI0025B2347D|nr:hypothetical protein [Actinomadura sp. DC4]MDN3356051.1 hypothetical protein [Actinomadura sp. DC4]
MSAPEIEYGEFWLPGGSDAHPDNPLAVCGRCGAIVLDATAHSRWHQAPALTTDWCEQCGDVIVLLAGVWVHANILAPDHQPVAPQPTGPEPKQFEVWEFDDGEIGRFSWGKDPNGNLSLAASTDGPGWCIWEAWRGEANERTPVRKIRDTTPRPGEVSR